MTGGLFTDFYELTMAQGYWKRQMNNRVVFDMFYRKNPFNNGFAVLAGNEPLLSELLSFSFSDDDILPCRSPTEYSENSFAFSFS